MFYKLACKFAIMNLLSQNRFAVILLGCVISLTATISSCRQLDVFEKNTNIPGMSWSYNFNANGTFTITDTAAAYNVYLVLRHTDAYLYNNIWLNVGIQAPGDSMNYSKVNLPLGNDATGWDGTGLNDIWEVRQVIVAGKSNFKKGNYQFNIAHIMRDNPLKNVMSVGLGIEKAGAIRE